MLFLLWTANTLLAQCPPPGFPDAGDDCPSAPILCQTLDGYCNTINNNNVPQTFPGCGPPWTLNNDEWFAFYAGTTTITIEVVPINCIPSGPNEGLQGGIYLGCGGPVMDVQCACTTNAFTLTSTNFIVGEIYWMVLDGCGGSVCDYQINVLQGSTAGGPPSDPGPISGPLTVCEGDTEAYSLLPVNAATIYNWNLNPDLGSISANDENANITWTTPGTTDLCVDVANACFANPTTSCITIEVIPTPTADLTGNGSICAEGTVTPVDLTINFTGTPPWEFVYSIDGVDQPPVTTSDNPYTLSVSTAGNIQLESVLSTTGSCPGTVTSNVTITETEIDPSATTTDLLCFGSADGEVDISVSGGSSPYSYQWSPSGNGQNPMDLPAGTYDITVTDNDGCTGEISVTLNEPPLLEASGQSSQDIDCDTPTGSISTTVSGGTPGYTYQWSPSGNGSDPTGLVDGTYYATVTDANGCTDTLSAMIAIDTIAPIAAAASTDTINCTSTSITIDGTGSETGPNITYQWTGPGIVSGGTTLNPMVDQPGTYTITVTNTETGCEEIATVTVAEDITPPVAMATAPPITCANGEITIDATGTDTGGNFTYQWSGPGIVSGGTTLMPVVDQSGSYTLTVTNTNNGCETTITVNVPEDTTLPDAVATAPPITCNNTSITIDGTGSETGPNITYQWTGPGIVSGETTLMPVVDQPGTYTLTVFDGNNGCENSVTVTVEDQTQLPDAVANADQITCANPTINIDGNGSSTGPEFTYQWTTNDGNIVSGSTTLNPTIDQPGTYTLTVVNTATGCENTVSVTVGEDVTPPIAEAGPTFELTCDITTVQLDGTGSDTGAEYTYQWTGPGIVSGGTTLNPTVDQPGTYTITVTNTDNGCETTDTVVVTEDVTPPIATASAPPITCDDPSVTISGNGSSTGTDFTYQWSGPGIISGGTTLNPTVDQPGTYTLTVTNTDNGCTEMATVTVQDLTQLPDAVANADPLTCANTSISIDGNGSSTGPNFTYQWSTTDGNIVSGSSQLNPLVDQTGTYTLLVENTTTGCENTVDVTVGIDTIPPIAEAGPTMELNCANEEVTLDGSGSSSGVGFSYSWDGPGVIFGGNTTTPIAAAPGIYTLTVVNDMNGCTASDVVEVTADFTTPDPAIQPPDIITCDIPEIQLDGSASTSGPNITYNWTTNGGTIISGGNTATPTVGSGGLYTIIVTDQDNGCDASISVVVEEDNDPPFVDAGPDLEITCVLQEIPLFGFNSVQGPEYSYLWTTVDGNIISGETTLSPIVNEPGTYTLTVFDSSNGCEASASTVVGVDSDVPISNAGPNQSITCTNSNPTLNGSGSSSGPGFTYTWSTTDGNIVSGANTLTPQVDQPGQYQLEVINLNNGCVAYSFVTVTEDIELPEAIIAQPGEVDCNNPTVTIDASASSSGSNFSYVWNTANGNIVSGQGTLMPVVDQGGNYVLTIINNTSGCINGGNVVVTENIDNPILNIENPGIISCTEPELTLDASGSDTGPEFEYSWTTIDGVIVSGAESPNPVISAGGTYELTIINLNTNCSTTDQVVVPEDADIPEVTLEMPDVLDCALSQLSLNAAISGGANLQYNWSTADGNFVSGTNTLEPIVDQPGTYLLEVFNEDTGCQSSGAVTVSQDILVPVSEAGPDSLLNCVVTSIVLDGSNSDSGADLNYQWTTPDGNILSGADGLMPEIDAAGTYILEVSNTQNSCFDADTLVVAEDVEIPASTIAPPILMGCADPIVTIDASGSTSGSGIIYQWTTPDGNILSGADGLMPEVDAPGTYSLVVLDTINGCSSMTQTTVIENTQLPIVDAGAGGELTCIVTSLELLGDAMGQTSNFEYSWVTTNGNITSGASTLTPTIDQAGTYTFVVTDTINQCSAEASVEITQDADLPVADVTASNFINCVQSSATLDGTGSTQGPDLIYTWTTTDGNFVGTPDDLMPEIDQPGSYTLTINDTINNCITSETIVIPADTLSPVLGITNPGELNCYTPEIMLDATAGGLNNLSILWTTTDGNILANADSLNPLIDLPGTYTLSVLNNDNGCSTEIQTLVESDFTPPIADAGGSVLLDCQLTEFNLQGTGNANGAVIEYLWTTNDGNILSGADTSTPLIDAGGTYQLEIINTENGCSTTDEVEIDQDQELPLADPGPDGIINCFASEISLDGTGSSFGPEFEYTWTTADGNILSGANGLSPNVDAPGTYTLTITNQDNNCTSADTLAVTEDVVPPMADAGPGADLSCSITETNLQGQASGGTNFSYTWTSTDGNILNGADTPTPLIDAGGTYLLEIINLDNGCADTSQTLVTNLVDYPLASAALDGMLNCNILSLTLDGSGSDQGVNFQYSWDTPDGNIVSGGTGLAPLVDQAGTYTLTVTDLSNDCISVSEVEVPIDTLSPIADAGIDGILNCVEESLILDGNGSSTGVDYIYAWTTPDGNILSGEDALSPEIDASGTYELTVQNLENGCLASDLVFVDMDTISPLASANVDDILTCTVLAINLDGAGSETGPDISYSWSTTDGNILNGANDLEPLVSQPGTYELTVINDENGCHATASIEVEQDIENPEAEAGIDGLLTCEDTEITLNGTASGANSPLAILWTSDDGSVIVGDTTENPTVNAPGIYVMEVTDMVNGCTDSDQVDVAEDIEDPNILISDPQLLTCLVDTVLLDATSSSSGSDYTVLWTTMDGHIITGENSLELMVDEPGTYLLEILNTENGCSSTEDVIVLQNLDTPIVDAGEDLILPCQEETSTLTGSVSGSSNLQFQWETTSGTIESGANSLSAEISGIGTYTLLVTNLDNGCTDSDVVEVTENIPSTPDYLAEAPLCSDELGILEITNVMAGTPPYLYSLDNGETFYSNPVFTNLDEGWYTILVQDALGCESETVDYFMDVPDPLVTSLDSQIEVLQGESYQLNLYINIPDTEILEIVWSPAEGLSCTDCLNPIASPLSTTTYQVEITSIAECRTEDEVQLIVDERPAVYAPNIFSPDGDGNNDLFYLFARPNSIKNIKSFLVFSRWGETVFSYSNFQPNNPAFGWDGNFRGQALNPGVFAWFAIVEMVDGRTELFEGDITLVR